MEKSFESVVSCVQLLTKENITNGAMRRIVKSLKQMKDSTFSTTTFSYQCHGFSVANVKAKSIENLLRMQTIRDFFVQSPQEVEADFINFRETEELLEGLLVFNVPLH